MAEHCESVLDAAGPVRSSSLGALSRLNDKTLLRIFTFFTPNVLLTASRVSWMFWALQDDDYLWRVLALLLLIDDDKKLGLFTFHGSWKATMLHPARYPNRSWDQQVKPPPLQGFVRDSPGRPAFTRLPLRDTQRWYDTRNEDLMRWPMHIRGVDRRERLTMQQFIDEYETPNRPVVITGAIDHWAARSKWLPKQFCDAYGELPVRSNGRSTNGRRFRMKLFDFLAYAASVNAEKYLYVFDKKIFSTHSSTEDDFEVPEYFREDLFSLMDEDDRPDYRWLLIGPHGSGSPLHTDPHRSSAWNAVLSGCKRVTFYPPHVVPPGVDEELIESEYYASDDCLDWYRNTLPTLKGDELPYETLVFPGDIVFIPSGWWHAVLNIGLTIAVTQNFCSTRTFPMVAADINEKGGKHLRRDFKCALAESTQYKHFADSILTKRR
jgi:hypothetical protein